MEQGRNDSSRQFLLNALVQASDKEMRAALLMTLADVESRSGKLEASEKARLLAQALEHDLRGGLSTEQEDIFGRYRGFWLSPCEIDRGLEKPEGTAASCIAR